MISVANLLSPLLNDLLLIKSLTLQIKFPHGIFFRQNEKSKFGEFQIIQLVKHEEILLQIPQLFLPPAPIDCG